MDHERHDAAPGPEDLFRARYTPARSCSAPGRPVAPTQRRRSGDGSGISRHVRGRVAEWAHRDSLSRCGPDGSRHRRDDHIGMAALADQLRHRGYGAHHLFCVGFRGDITL